MKRVWGGQVDKLSQELIQYNELKYKRKGEFSIGAIYFTGEGKGKKKT